MNNFTSFRIVENIDCYKNFTNDIIGLSSEICSVNLPTKNFLECDEIKSGVTINSNNVIILTGNTIDLHFRLSGDTTSLINNNLTYSFELYKFDNEVNKFDLNSKLIKNNLTPLSSQTLTFNSRELAYDSEFLIKTKYSIDRCVGYNEERYEMNNNYLGEYGNYNRLFDDYFILLKEPSKPVFTTTEVDLLDSTINKLKKLTFYIKKRSNILEFFVSGITDFILVLNGSLLSETLDYNVSGTSIIFEDFLYPDDIINIVYLNSNYSIKLYSEVYEYDSIISSGSTNNNNEKLFYNNIKNKFEYYLDYEPHDMDNFLVSLNGVFLNKDIDYMQSLSDPKRIIFNGYFYIDDIITFHYINNIPYINEVSKREINISWLVELAPLKRNGYFLLEVSDDKNFNNIIYSGITNYIANVNSYNIIARIEANLGDELFYRVKNIKNFVTISGDILTLEKNSDHVKILIVSSYNDNY